jgi:hypothetical protein
VAEQWRVAIMLGDAAGAGRSGLMRCKRDLAREMDRTGVVVVGVPSSGFIARLGASLAVGSLLRSSAESPLSAFTGDRATAEAAAQVAREVTGRHGLAARVSVECWRPVKKLWEDASAVSKLDLAEEYDYLQREDRRVSARTGVAQWQVRVKLRTHSDAVTLAQRLSSEGHQVDRRWTSVLASAHTRDDALRLAERVQLYVPSAAEVVAERANAPDYIDDANFSGGIIP